MNFLELNKKKILFFYTKTFSYEKEIINKMISLGAEVECFDERPSNSILVKGIIRVKRSLFQKKINAYYQNILSEIGDKQFDYLFVIKGEVVPSKFLDELRKRLPNCKFIYYTWDSFENNPSALSILHHFDKKITFDHVDAIKYNLKFRPLFYIDRYKMLNSKDTIKKYDLLFLGTAHTDRYKVGNKLTNWCDQNGFSSFAYYFMPSRSVYFIKLLFDSSFKRFDYGKLSFKSLQISDIINLYDKSSIILDVNHPNQKGLTMRTFEALGASKKIITTNTEIRKYVFYNENNILIIDRNNIDIPSKFFESKFNPLDSEILESMSITGWLRSIFIDEETMDWIK